MLRMLLAALALLQVSGLATPALRGAVMRPQLGQRVAPATFAMQEDTKTDVTPPMELDPTCIEDESIEECTLISWPAGKISVRAFQCCELWARVPASP